ncbi:MAG TPA: hypothetical protein VFE19_00650 [Jatrophihabitantaceae bacterium]|jgi:uncharacterized membrane protein|nr:hypothetical protein [Jatrophihabitantaceae bacterium]
MTETTLLGPAGLGYLTDVGVALADVGAGERDELLEEVHEHLNAIVAELGHDIDRDALVARLGPPRRYAAELMAAAGLEADSKVEQQQVATAWQAMLRAPNVAAVTAYLRRLEPAWWLLRGYLIAGLILPWAFGLRGVFFGGSNFAQRFFTHWRFDDAGFNPDAWRTLWLVPIFILVVGSVILGLRAERTPVRWRVTSRVTDFVGVVALVLVPTWWAGSLMYDFVLRQ